MKGTAVPNCPEYRMKGTAVPDYPEYSKKPVEQI